MFMDRTSDDVFCNSQPPYSPAKEKPPFQEEELRFSRGQADVSVQKAVEGFGAFGQFGEISVF